MIYLELFLAFLKVGLFSFGGAYAAIPLIREVVLSYGWMSEESLSYMIAVSESTPGPVMVNVATYVGSSQGGLLGAFISTFTVILPAFVIILLIMVLFKKLLKNEAFSAVLTGLKSCVAGIILATGTVMAIDNITDISFTASPDIKALILTAVLAAVLFLPRIRKKKVNPILFIGISAVLGAAVYGI